MKKTIMSILTGILVIIAYFTVPILCEIPYQLFNLDFDSFSLTVKITYILLTNLVTLCLIIILLNHKIKKDFKDFKKNNMYYFKDGLKYWLIGLAIMMISNLIINTISSEGIANNEDTLRKLFDLSPVYVFFAAVIFAPLLEELTFRLGIRKIFKNDYIFIIISGVLFGALHVIDSYKTLFDLLYIIPYSSLGVMFAYMLKKYDNIFVTVWFHFMHNGLLTALQFFILFFS